MYIKTKFFQHFKWLNEAVDKLRGEAFVNIANLVVEIRLDNKVYVLYPMFTTLFEGRKVYTYQFTQDTHNFVGWKPYRDRETPELGKKLSFKRFVEKNNLSTPAYSVTDDPTLKNVIVKIG